MGNIRNIDGTRFKGKTPDTEASILACESCGNSLFYMIECDGEILPACQHCREEFDMYSEEFVEAVELEQKYIDSMEQMDKTIE